MISIELARELRDAGLVWEPKEGDAYWLHGDGEIFFRIDGISDAWKEKEIDSTLILYRVAPECFLWAPYLSQLLAEIEKRGYRWNLCNLGGFGDHYDDVCMGLFDRESREYVQGRFYGTTPEDAAAKALLWILRGDRNG